MSDLLYIRCIGPWRMMFTFENLTLFKNQFFRPAYLFKLHRLFCLEYYPFIKDDGLWFRAQGPFVYFLEMYHERVYKIITDYVKEKM